ncbi:GNAT family N-acetyltransferase [Paenibacillus sp. NEAU-GSW1]|uniref:GNAT family N-acetyltransferase n=1 Tax=Paenibacillus sp. NEAU-GSW1 TaxID=2682486 RepID=UPI0012E2824E|nr:GNAT family N-acetyltransferase [Paenibacillus sp. NEAU-GSW1]MUT67225.1 GNAT family N-acetyltransferase [Paenibacillus sp. NEAU-GSW1]
MKWRLAVPEDEPLLYELYAETRRKEVGGWGFEANAAEAFLRMQYRARAMSYAAAFPNAEIRILCQDETPIGVLRADYGSEAVAIVDIALLPEYRAKGIGSEWIRQLQEEASERKLPLKLQVEHGNAQARKLYNRLGFAETSADEIRASMSWSPA